MSGKPRPPSRRGPIHTSRRTQKKAGPREAGRPIVLPDCCDYQVEKYAAPLPPAEAWKQ
jgi:hypothetical protein